jgi:ABC-type uncharacterized transport system ATPase subunit
MNFPQINQTADKLTEEFDYPPSRSREFSRKFIGGNQQKVVVARDLIITPDFCWRLNPHAE